ncbi:hypothetical protein CKO31_09410 [Thiohalocapsa halophila]|uniref:BrnT family toxin n=1 Tax=Thiohalocapsa halophila TaxID=69359 RepID=A0ABS1CHI6_9GAMM|nr:BrnT family toxin [Thiohalocapsa halophila]MBK1630954.1 hypothetical protein [Thiohalocapsa halophila]
MKFEWDERKNQANRRKHGVDFRQAIYAFSDPFALNLPDEEHSALEDRWVLLGAAAPNRLVVVVHTDRSSGRIRIISARKATRREHATYESRLQR